jgi:2-polyprenyl-3-methyl-5-hydroxy-6-metoxy-1,4-benzoquinol methylase
MSQHASLPQETLRTRYNDDFDYFANLSHWYESGAYSRRLSPLIARLASWLRSDATILDAGCAVGAVAVELARKGMRRIIAADFSHTALRFSRKNLKRAGALQYVSLIEGDVENPAFLADDSVDLIVAADIIEHVQSPSAFVAEMLRVCRPGGVMLVETPNTRYRRHRVVRILDLISRVLRLEKGRNLFPTDPSRGWDDYHISLLAWPELAALLRRTGWTVLREEGFGWWFSPGASEKMLLLLAHIAGPVAPSLRFAAYSDVLIIVQKPLQACRSLKGVESRRDTDPGRDEQTSTRANPGDGRAPNATKCG